MLRCSSLHFVTIFGFKSEPGQIFSVYKASIFDNDLYVPIVNICYILLAEVLV